MQKKILLFIAFSLLILYPPVYSWFNCGIQTVFNSFADDAFYYLTVAKNYRPGMPITFDGANVTNGFHPLWQFFLIELFRLFPDQQATQLTVTFACSVGLVLLGLVFTAWAVMDLTKSFWAPFWLIPGLYFVFFQLSPAEGGLTYTYSLWSFMNGLESPPTLFFGGLLFFLISKHFFEEGNSPSEADAAKSTAPAHNYWLRHLTAGFLLAFIVLSRLDDVFILPAFLLAVACAKGGIKKKIVKILLICGPPSLAIIIYMAYNQLTVGTPTPVSGQLKSGHWLTFNFITMVRDFVPALLEKSPSYDISRWKYSSNRDYALAIPIIFAIFFLFNLWHKKRTERKQYEKMYFMVPLLLYIIFKGLYNFIEVKWKFQGYWYFPYSILLFNVLCILFFVGSQNSPRRQGLREIIPFLSGLWVVIYLTTSSYIINRLVTEPHVTYRFWKDRKEIAESLRKIDPDIKLIDGHDGYIAYSLPFPAAPSTGLVTSPDGIKAYHAGKYQDFYFEQGYNVLAALPGGGYIKYPDEKWSKELIYRHEPTQILFSKIVRISPQ